MRGRFAFSLVFVTLFIFLSCAYQRNVSELLVNKALLYYSGDTAFRRLSLIIEKRGDSIFNGYVRSSSLEEWFDLKESSQNTSHLHLPFQHPYKLQRVGKKVMLSFNVHPAGVKQRIHHQVQYLLNREDSVECIDLTYLCNQEMGYSKYLGDTTLIFSGTSLKCYAFKEYYRRSRLRESSRDLTITRYFEKTTWIPIIIDSDFYELAGFGMPALEENKTYSILYSIIPSDSLEKLDPKTRYCY